jgi:6-phosphogluconolactonase
VFVSIERQNQLYVYKLQPNNFLVSDPLFIATTLADPSNVRPGQAAGAIHVHPTGRFVYVTNRNSGTVDFEGKKVSNGGENNIAVFAIDQATGEPTLLQHSEARTIHLRTFSIDASGRLLVAASILPMAVRDGTTVITLAAGLSVYRVGSDGRLDVVRTYDVDTGKFMQFWSGMVTLA